MAKPSNTTLGNQLQRYRPFVKKVKPTRFELPATDSIGIDGIDHINVWYRGETDLGKAFDQLADTPFSHPTYGNFGSIEGFWQWLRSETRDDRVRHMSGMKARKFGAKLRTQWVKDFHLVIMQATWCKVLQYPPLQQAIVACQVPFDLYTVSTNTAESACESTILTRTRPISAFWIIPGLEEIRLALRENREPDFSFLIEPEKQRKTQGPTTAQERRSTQPNPLLSGRTMGKKREGENTKLRGVTPAVVHYDEPAYQKPLLESQVFEKTNTPTDADTAVCQVASEQSLASEAQTTSNDSSSSAVTE